MKKTGAETVSSVHCQLCSLGGRTTLRLGVMIVFITQMLLMIAGDVEPNPGPGEREEWKSEGGGEERERVGKKMNSGV